MEMLFIALGVVGLYFLASWLQEMHDKYKELEEHMSRKHYTHRHKDLL